jgi:hypothetical protein
LPDPEQPEKPEQQQDSLFSRVIRSAIAPDVLEDGGADAPLSSRGRVVFYAIVAVLVVAIVVLLLVTASSN